MVKKIKAALVLSLFLAWGSQANLVETIERIKPSVVGIGIYTPLGQPRNVLRGTGFAVANGQYVVTNQHVLPEALDEELNQQMVVFVGNGKDAKPRKATIVDSDLVHDLAVLKVEGNPLVPMKLAKDKFINEGTSIAFTGFPIGAVLGLYPVTHRGIIASVTPTVVPVADSRSLSIKMVMLMKKPYMVYQLDATAYPGNSGSAMYDQVTGEVVGVINKVFVQDTKEGVISKPSGITYAIPVKWVHELLAKNNISL